MMLSYYCPPAASAGIFRTVRFVKYLPEFGWKPLVVTVSPEALHHRRLDRSLGKLIHEEAIVARTPVWRPCQSIADMIRPAFHRDSKAKRGTKPNGRSAVEQTEPTKAPKRQSQLRHAASSLRDLLAATPDAQIGWMIPAVRAALPLIRKHRPKVIYSSGPPHSSHLIAVVLKRITGIPIVIDFRDPWARCEWGTTTGLSAQQRVQCWLERLCVSSADSVVLNTVPLRNEFQSAYGTTFHSKFKVITNGYDPDLRNHAEGLLARTRNMIPDGAVRLCHPGGVYGRRTLLHLIAAIKDLVASGHRVIFEQIGLVNGQNEPSQHTSTESVQFRGQLPHDKTLERMAVADILVVIQPDTSIQVPGKLFEMLPFRKPLLVLTGKGATADIIQRFKLGVVADPTDQQAIASAIMQVANGQCHCPGNAEWKRALDTFDGRLLTSAFADTLNAIA